MKTKLFIMAVMWENRFCTINIIVLNRKISRNPQMK